MAHQVDNQVFFPNEPIRFTQEGLDQLLMFCTQADSSDITIQTSEQVMAEIYGRLHKVTNRKISNNEVGEIINYMYGPNGTTQLLSGVDVDTHYEIRPNRTDRYRFRINATSCMVDGRDGIQITARVIPNEPPDLESLDLPQNIIDALAPDQGVVYVTGATGSGKSTLLASIIKSIVSSAEGHRKVLTYESPIEFVFDSVEKPTSMVSQSEIPRHLPGFAAGVRNALRRKPRLILVGESRDEETMRAVLEAALTGHPVYTTLHSNGVSETVRRLVTTFPIDERHGRTIDLIETVRLIVWQKLVPTVDGKRVALREYLVFDEDVRDELLSSDLDQVIANTRRLLNSHGQTMAVDAQKRFDEGIIAERDYQLILRGVKNADKDARV
ncbi:MAG: Dot/Icm type IV secretion system ATPase DotB [Gammaproteobacteria bacterium]|nr:Dot/Icm type IV secretion system ATPase DotB [Gammaproteobacteria bacterium]